MSAKETTAILDTMNTNKTHCITFNARETIAILDMMDTDELPIMKEAMIKHFNFTRILKWNLH